MFDNARNHTPHLETLEGREVPAVIGGIVYHDLNQNGLYDSGEPGIANSRLRLYDSSNQLIATTFSDSTGRYQFTQRGNAQPQPAQLVREVVFSESKTNHMRNASLAQFDPNLGTLTAVEIIGEGSLSSIVQLENMDDQSARLTTELKGNFRFDVGSTTLESSPERILQATLGAFDGQADLQGSSARDFGTTRLTGSFTRMVLTNPADMAEFVGNGSINVSQIATMSSFVDGPGNLLAAIRTSAAGKVRVVYHYTPGGNLGPGDYTIVQNPQPRGFLDWYETSGNSSVIPNSNRTDSIAVSVTDFSQQLTSNHFAELRPSSLTGRVYNDRDRSGGISSGDRWIAGVTIILTGNDIFGNAISRTTRTNALGTYRFGNLPPGTYTIHEVQPAGYQQGTNSPGRNPTGMLTGIDDIEVTLDQGQNGTDYNFGEIGGNPITPPPRPITPIPQPSKFFLFFGSMGNTRR